MPVHLTDSLIYQNSWGTPELRALFDDVPRTRSWLEILAVLAETQAAFDVIPRDVAQLVASTCRTIELNEAFFEEVRLDFETTNHSTLGLIRAVQRRCPGNSGEWLYYGATVQDITDTWTALVLQRVRGIAGRELKEIERNLARPASEHRNTVMAGRTPGQIGLPITFGFKAAVWAMEIRRHRVRLAEIAPRLDVGQLAGGVGSLSSLGPRALELQQSAHILVYETAMNARATGRGLKDAILDMPEFSRYLTINEIEALFEYRQHTGHCGAMVDQVVAALRDADTPKNLM